MNNTGKKLKFSEKISYGLGDCSANVVAALVSTYLTAYYTDSIGIAAAAVGTMMLLARVFDGVTDVIMGVIVDKTSTRWGKARPWLLWTAPFMALALILLFHVPTGMSDGGKLVYAYLTYIFQNCIVYTACNLPYNALLSRMTLNVQERASVSSMRFFMTQITSLIITALTANLMESLGWHYLSIIYGIVACAMLIISFLGTKEHIGEDEASGTVKVDKVPIDVSVKALVKNKYFFIQTILFCFFYAGSVGIGTMTYYYCNNILGSIKYITYFTMAKTLAAASVNMILPKLVSRFGKRKMMMSGGICMAVGGFIIGSAHGVLPVALAGMTLYGAGIGIVAAGVFATTADIVDYGEWKTGVRSEGLVNSCTSFGMKVGIGMGSFLGAKILEIGGYIGTAQQQTETALNAINFGFGYMGCIVGSVCFILCLLLNVDKYMGEVQQTLEKKHAKEQ